MVVSSLNPFDRRPDPDVPFPWFPDEDPECSFVVISTYFVGGGC